MKLLEMMVCYHIHPLILSFNDTNLRQTSQQHIRLKTMQSTQSQCDTDFD